jgi:hypothetical protein
MFSFFRLTFFSVEVSVWSTLDQILLQEVIFCVSIKVHFVQGGQSISKKWVVREVDILFNWIQEKEFILMHNIGGMLLDLSTILMVLCFDMFRLLTHSIQTQFWFVVFICVDPNCDFGVENWKGLQVVVVRALREITTNEFLSLDYGWISDNDSELKEPCYCGSRNCTGFLFRPSFKKTLSFELWK